MKHTLWIFVFVLSACGIKSMDDDDLHVDMPLPKLSTKPRFFSDCREVIDRGQPMRQEK